ncbi:MAG: cobyrinic acid a,c-diamide synthase, partial [Marmoricola sp.]|nr:cobyrinic acid a,c-diamide synthase [Marmoricola sp.]
HAREVAGSIRVPVLGTVGRDDAFSAPSRHLGLVPAAERDEARHALDLLAAHLAEAVDLEAVLAVAATAPDLDVEPWDPAAEVEPPTARAAEARPVVAMAGGRAFTFRYAETEELLRAAGCDVVAFDPLTDRDLPPGTRGIYLGGGFPEVHAATLTANAPLRQVLRESVAAGVPTVAECAGLLYLCDTLDDEPMVGALAAHARMTPRLTLRYPEAVAASDSLLGRAGEVVTGHEFHRTVTDPPAGSAASADAGGRPSPLTTADPAWEVEGQLVGFATGTLHASYLHTHWAGHPQLAQRFADAVHASAVAPPPAGPPGVSAAPRPAADRGAARGAGAPARTTCPAPADPLLHHGDAEVGEGLLDLAVNVHPGPRPPWLDAALRASLDDLDRYPSATAAEDALATRHGRAPEEVLATAGAAEAFTLVARARPWRLPVVVHPQFTEPHAALRQAGHDVHVAATQEAAGFALRSADVPDDADLVVVGNPTNPTGVLHPAEDVRRLLRPGRVVVVDEAFMDTVPGETASLAAEPQPGLLVVRSLTKHWSIPGVRAGYVLGAAEELALLRAQQVPWSFSTTAAAAVLACATPAAREEAERRAEAVSRWRATLCDGLAELGFQTAPSSTSFVLVRVGEGVHADLRAAGIAVRRADTFPGLGPAWVRIAVRPEAVTRRLLDVLGAVARARAPHPLG